MIVPCFNEQDNVELLTKRLVAVLEREYQFFEIILVDDASEDETWSRICQVAEHFRQVIPVRAPKNEGMFHAWKRGLEAATGRFSVLIDADLQNPPEAIPSLIVDLDKSGSDMSQGFRSSIAWLKGARYFSSRGLNLLLNLVFGDSARDHKSGFVAARTSNLQKILDYGQEYNFPQTFIRASAKSLGLVVSEVETLFVAREAGESFLTKQSPLAVYARVLADFPKAVRRFGRTRVSHPFLNSVPTNKGRVHQASGDALRYRFYFSSMPLHAWLIRGRPTRDVLERLRGSQWLDLDESREVQRLRLEKILGHAYSSTPYYRLGMDREGIRPSDLGSLDDIEAFPLLSKEDVRQNLHMGMFAEGHDKRKMLRIQTSGSTGTPSITYADQNQLEVRFASTIRAFEWTGWRFGEPQLRLWHQRLGMTRSQFIRESLDARLLRREFVPAFEMTIQGLHLLQSKIDSHKPVLIDGYAESLNFVGEFLLRGGSLKHSPRAFMSSAQILTESTRKLLEESTGARVFDKYGAREFSGIAYQCEIGRDYHVMDESYLVEILKDGRKALPGELGEVVITDLNNYSTPMIRYRIGDLAMAVDNSEPCGCGRTLSRIGPIQGRTQALVFCTNGRWLPGTFFAHFFKDYPHLVAHFQIVQEIPHSFTLKVVKGGQWNHAGWERLLAGLREFVGETEISTQFVDEIPLLATGKRTPVVSTVKADFQTLSSSGFGEPT